VERNEDPYLLAVSKKDGKTAWKVDALGTTAWSSPRLVPVGDAQHLVLSGSGQLRGIDPESGKTLWSFDGITNNSTPTPIPVGNGRFLMGATVGRSNSDAGNAAASNALLEIKSRDDGTFAVDFVWRAKRATSSFGSPLAHNGYAYFVNRSGVVYCLDLKTGEELYAKRTSGSIWATPIGVGERIYLFGKDGTTTVIQSGPEFKELTTNSLWKKEAGAAPFGGAVLYAAALVDSGLVLRRGDRLYKISR